MRFEHLPVESIQFVQALEVRTKGTDRTLSVPWSEKSQLPDEFHALHHKKYGYSRPDIPIEITTINVIANAQSSTKWHTPKDSDLQAVTNIASSDIDDLRLSATAAAFKHHQLYANLYWHQCRLYERADLLADEVIYGPAIVVSGSHTMVVNVGWVALVCDDHSLIAKRIKVQNIDDPDKSAPLSTGMATNEIVLREVLAQRFAAIAYQMGLVLEQTAISVNIRDRRDFSCAVFDAQGFLIANAPHVPVHLGAMQATVQYALQRFPMMKPGDSFITNDPQCGGSHLPDITLITPVFSRENELVFFVANRAHHAEIGGLAPGSMAPNSTTLAEEGVVIPIQYLTDGAQDRYPAIQSLLEHSPYPSRLPLQNLADISAQAAANQRGALALRDLLDEIDPQVLLSTTQDILKATEIKVCNWIRALAPRVCSFADCLDDGTPVTVTMNFEKDRLKIDFSGSGPISPRNFNASVGIVQAAVLYVIRTLMVDALPLNSGALRPVELIVPTGLLNPEVPDDVIDRPAVAAGNVETSQRIVDVLLGALGVCGASQGTMNNLLMGNERFGFYETLGGGTGATINRDGAPAVHSHMTNTRLTDPEVLEQRYPVRLRQLAIRSNSGGTGDHRGGDGMIREFEFLEDLQVSLITSRRPPYTPYGQSGGANGLSGRNYLIDRDGNRRELPGCAQFSVIAGQRIRIETPGGGGYGTPQ
jgi:5-oxoprolinase (ATP-hydrolysing)